MGVFAIRGFVALAVDSLLDRVRDANFCRTYVGKEPGTRARVRGGRAYAAGKPARVL